MGAVAVVVDDDADVELLLDSAVLFMVFRFAGLFVNNKRLREQETSKQASKQMQSKRKRVSGSESMRDRAEFKLDFLLWRAYECVCVCAFNIDVR